MKVTQREINKIARHINKMNELLLKTIGEAESLVNDPIVRELINQGYDHPEILKKLAASLRKISAYDEMVNVSTYDSYFQDFDNLIANIEDNKEWR